MFQILFASQICIFEPQIEIMPLRRGGKNKKRKKKKKKRSKVWYFLVALFPVSAIGILYFLLAGWTKIQWSSIFLILYNCIHKTFHYRFVKSKLFKDASYKEFLDIKSYFISLFSIFILERCHNLSYKI